MDDRWSRSGLSMLSRQPRLLGALVALVTALAGVLVAAPPAQAQSVCMGDNPPDFCFNDPAPSGQFTSATRVPSGVSVAGWVKYYSSSTVIITIGGVAAGTLPITSTGNFSGTVPVSRAGQVCVQSADHTNLNCASLFVNQAPFGSFDGLATSGNTMHLTGWAIDPDSAAPTSVAIIQDSLSLGTYAAGAPRPDVGAAYPGYGNNHGFDLTLSQGTEGTHRVCIYVVKPGYGSGTVPIEGCRTYEVRHNPYGSLDQVARSGTNVAVSGWAVDPDQPTAAVSVTVTTDGGNPTTVTANLNRPDVGNAHPEAGAAHGYSTTIPANLAGGGHTVCATAVNLAWGSNVQLGCLSYSTPAPVVAPKFVPFASSWPYMNLNPKVSSIDSNNVNLAWTDSSTSTKDYVLERSDSGGPWHELYSWTSISQNAAGDGPLAPETQYCWRLTASNDVSSASDVICGTTLKAPLPLPTDYHVSSTDTSITMSWTDNAGQPANYLVGIGPKQFTLDGVTWVTVPATGGAMSHTFTGLTPGAKYYVQAFPVLAGYEASIGGVGIPISTTAAPVVDSFTASPTAVQVCSPQPITLSWHTTSATHVVVTLGSTTLADRTQANPDPWSDSYVAAKTDTSQTYKIVAYSPDGRSTTKTVTVGQGSVYPTIHSLMFSNTGWETLTINSVDLNGNITKAWGTIAPGETKVLTLPNCQLQIIRLDSPTRIGAWYSNGVILGWDQGAILPPYGVG